MSSLHQFDSKGLPSDWKIVQLAEFGHLTDGDWILNQHYSNDGVRLLQVGDVGVGRFEDKSRRFISRATADALKCTVLQRGQVLISRMPDPIGRACLVPTLPYPAITAVDVAILSPKPDLVDRDFAVMVLNSDINLNQCKSLATGVTRQRVSRSNLGRVELPLPPLAEQRKIAGVLELVQRAIEQQERLLALTAELKKALLCQLFTHGLRHEPQKQTELGPIPQSWDVAELGSVAGLINGFAFKSEDYVSNGVLNFRVVNIRDEGVIDVSNDTEFLPKQFMQSHKPYLLSEEDILVVMVGATRGKMGFIPKAILPALMNQNMWRIVPKSPTEMHRRYLYHFLTTAVPTFVREFSESARGFFKKSDFRAIKLPKPGFDEQREIAGAIDNVEQKLALHRRKHAALSALCRTSCGS
jgi:type I restriction enzyme S subunit